MFRQILTVAPDFYSHSWEKLSNYREPQLIIGFPEPESIETEQLDRRELSERNEIFKKRLLERTKRYHEKFMHTLKEATPALYKDHNPEEEQTWFHLFNLERDTEPIPLADLKPQGKNF